MVSEIVLLSRPTFAAFVATTPSDLPGPLHYPRKWATLEANLFAESLEQHQGFNCGMKPTQCSPPETSDPAPHHKSGARDAIGTPQAIGSV